MVIATTLVAVAAMVSPGAPAPAADGTDVNFGSAGSRTYIRDTITMPAYVSRWP